MQAQSQFIDPVDPNTVFLITNLKNPNELYVAKAFQWSWREDGHWRIYWEHLLLGSSIDWEVTALKRQGEKVLFQSLDGTIYLARPLTYALYLERVASLLVSPPLLATDYEVQAYFQDYTPPSLNREELKKGLDQAISEMLKKIPPEPPSEGF